VTGSFVLGVGHTLSIGPTTCSTRRTDLTVAAGRGSAAAASGGGEHSPHFWRRRWAKADKDLGRSRRLKLGAARHCTVAHAMGPGSCTRLWACGALSHWLSPPTIHLCSFIGRTRRLSTDDFSKSQISLILNWAQSLGEIGLVRLRAGHCGAAASVSHVSRSGKCVPYLTTACAWRAIETVAR
jgi:hypothetical protein